MSKSLVFAFLFLGSLQPISAQINFYESMFGHHHQQQQPPQQPLRHAYADGVSCSQYLCPTLDCVALPKDCPCPNVEDIKCLIPDMVAGAKATKEATVVCTRGQNGCTEVDKLMRKGVKSQKK